MTDETTETVEVATGSTTKHEDRIYKAVLRIANALERANRQNLAKMTPEERERLNQLDNPNKLPENAIHGPRAPEQKQKAVERAARETEKDEAVGERAPIVLPSKLPEAAAPDFLSETPTVVPVPEVSQPEVAAVKPITVEEVRAALVALAKKDGNKRDRGLAILAEKGDGAAALPGSNAAAQGGVKLLDARYHAAVVAAVQALLDQP